MQAPTEKILTEERLNHLGSIMADCIKVVYKDDLPNATFTVYMRSPKYGDRRSESATFRYDVSDNSVDGETLQNYMDRYEEPLCQCILDKLSPNKDRDPGRNWVGYNGRVLTLKIEKPPTSIEPIKDISIDESKWIEVIKFSQRKNWYSKIRITKGRVVEVIISLSASEIWEYVKPYIVDGINSGNSSLNDLLEKIKDLPSEKIVEKWEEIEKMLDGFLL